MNSTEEVWRPKRAAGQRVDVSPPRLPVGRGRRDIGDVVGRMRREEVAAGEVAQERLARLQEGGVVGVVAGDPAGELGQHRGDQRQRQLRQHELGRVEVGGDEAGPLVGGHRLDPRVAGRRPLVVLRRGVGHRLQRLPLEQTDVGAVLGVVGLAVDEALDPVAGQLRDEGQTGRLLVWARSAISSMRAPEIPLAANSVAAAARIRSLVACASRGRGWPSRGSTLSFTPALLCGRVARPVTRATPPPVDHELRPTLPCN
jgi:hypothetical protein